MKIKNIFKNSLDRLTKKIRLSSKRKNVLLAEKQQKILKTYSDKYSKPNLSGGDVDDLSRGKNHRVLMFGWELPPFNSGGLGTACYHLAHSLTKSGAKVTFVLPKQQDIKAPFDVVSPEDYGIKYIEIDSRLRPYLTAEEYFRICEEGDEDKARYYGQNLIDEVVRYGVVAGKLARRMKFDVIHAHDWLSFPAGIKAKAATKRPFIAHVHAIEHDRSFGVNEAICEIEKEGLEAADRVIANSQYTKDRIVRYYGINPEKIDVVHNGIVATKSKFDKLNFVKLKEHGYKIVLFVGRITYQKGLDYLIRAAQKVLAKNKKVYFIIAGSGDMQYQMIDLAASLGISDKVLFAGFLRGPLLEKTYQSANLFVMPSVSEPYGIVALEALINDTPILVSNQSGVSESITNALKVDFWDIDQMAEHILSIVEDEDFALRLAKNGAIEAGAQTWDRAAKKCINVYAGLVA